MLSRVSIIILIVTFSSAAGYWFSAAGYGTYLLKNTDSVVSPHLDEMSLYGERPVASAEVAELAQLLDKQQQLHGGTIPVDLFRTYYEEYGPETIRDALDADNFCHSEAHNFGRVIHEKTRDLAISTAICGSSCKAGCIHGVLMSMFEEKSHWLKTPLSDDDHVGASDVTDEFRKEMEGLCKDDSAVVRITGIGNCYHAIGHALATLADLDVSDSLALCSNFKNLGEGAVYYCTTGVYMERDIQLGDADQQVSQTYPCLDGPFPAACFRYKISRIFRFARDLEKAKALCLSLAGAQKHGCFHGVGLGAAGVVLRDPGFINAVCGEGDDLDRRMCLEGVFGFMNTHTAGAATRACAFYTADDPAECNAAAALKNFDTRRDFRSYTVE